MNEEKPKRTWTQESLAKEVAEINKNRPCSKCEWNNRAGSTYWCRKDCDFHHSDFQPQHDRAKTKAEQKKLWYRRKKAEAEALKKTLILAITILLSIPVVKANAETAEFKGTEALWEIVSAYSPNDNITAAVVAQCYFESGCIANAVGGGYLLGDDHDEKVTAAIDKGLADGSTKDGFQKHKIGKYQVWGYGLIQWVDPTECGKLYDYAQACGTSIGDAQTQVAFIFDNVKNNFPEVWEKLLDAESAADAGRIFAHFIGGTDLAEKLEDRAWYAEELVKEYGE